MDEKAFWRGSCDIGPTVIFGIVKEPPLASPSSNDTIQLGIIGTGLAVEKLHWPALKRMTDRYRVTAFANRGRAGAERFAGYSGVLMDAYTADYRELLARDDVDAVLISLPIPMNLPVTRDALAAGKDVICEKPTGANADEMRAFTDLPGQYPDRTVLIAENWFYRDDLRQARALLDQGILGRVHLMAWRSVSQLVPRDREFSSTLWRQDAAYVGGPHLDGGVHQLAQIRFLCGDAERVSGETQDANDIFAGPSDLAMTLRFVSGATGSYTASYPEYRVPEEPNDMRIYGDEGTMAIAGRTIRVFRTDGSVERWQVEMPDGGYYNEFLNFYEACTGAAPLVGTIEQSVRNMELLMQALASAETGREGAMAEGPIPLAADAVPLWKPAGAEGIFDGLDGVSVEHTTEKAS
jgi:predicted dehydrogenase